MAKRAAEDAEAQLYDINNTSSFNDWFDKSMRTLGASGYGTFTQKAIADGKIDPEIARCENLANDLAFLAPGKSYNGVTYADGLTVGQLRVVEPLPPRNQRIDTEKTRTAYARDCGTAINFMKLRMEDHTIAYFENMTAFNEAVERRDLVAFGRILKSRGIIGTGDVDEARLKLEGEIYEVADNLKLENQGTKGFDFNQHSIQYRRTAKTLSELGSQVSEKTMVRSYILSLPGKSIKTQLAIGGGAPTTLEAAIATVRTMIIAQNISLTDCASAFVLDDDVRAKTKKHKPSESIETMEMLVATAVTNSMNAMSKKREEQKAKNFEDRAAKRLESRAEFFNRECTQLARDGFCDFEKRQGKECRYKHGTRSSRVDGVIKVIGAKAEKK